MNRKLVNGLLLVTLASGGCGMFTSCKDTDEDWNNKVIVGQQDLKSQLNALKAQVDAIKQCTCNPNLEADLKDWVRNQGYQDAAQVGAIAEAKVAAVQGQLNTLQGNFDALKAAIDNPETGLGALEALVKALQLQVNTVETSLNTLGGRVDTVEGDVNTLKSSVGELKTALEDLSPRLQAVETGLTKVQEEQIQMALDIVNQGNAITALETLAKEQGKTLEELGEELAKQSGILEEQGEAIETLGMNLGALDTQINGKGGIAQNVEQLMTKVANNEADIDNLYDLIEGQASQIRQLQAYVRKYFGNIYDNLNRQVSSIIMNQAWNPIFGSINLPIGLATTMAGSYYGYATHDVDFPLSLEASATAYEAMGAESGLEDILSDADLVDALRSSIKGGLIYYAPNTHYMNDSENNLGQLYLSINPTHIDYKNIDFELVTSTGKVAPIDVNVVETNEELTFGITRSAANGFYRANLHIDANKAPQIGIKVEEGLKSALKDALKNRQPKDLVNLAKEVAKQMEGFLPAYGLKATWEAPSIAYPELGQEPVKYTYISQYNIAATAMRPLGYNTLSVLDNPDREVLPTFGSIKQVFNDFFNDLELDFKIDFEPIEFEPLKKLDISIDIKDIDLGNPTIEINLGGIEVKGDKFDPATGTYIPNQPIGTVPEGETITLTYNPALTKPVQGDGALNEFIDNITTQINEMLADMDTQINDKLIAEVNDLIEKQIGDQITKMISSINDQLAGINGQITESIDKIKDQIQNSLAGKLGKVDNLIEKYNALANRVNNILKNPNHYVQVAMAYDTKNNGLGFLSSDINDPTQFEIAGGNALTLYATSYTADIVVPSYKKYVAVSRVWDENGQLLPGYSAEAQKANTAEYLNALRPGGQQKFYINVNDLKPGYKYEVLYSSLDYQGWTSTRTFYLVVKNKK